MKDVSNLGNIVASLKEETRIEWETSDSETDDLNYEDGFLGDFTKPGRKDKSLDIWKPELDALEQVCSSPELAGVISKYASGDAIPLNRHRDGPVKSAIVRISIDYVERDPVDGKILLKADEKGGPVYVLDKNDEPVTEESIKTCELYADINEELGITLLDNHLMEVAHIDDYGNLTLDNPAYSEILGDFFARDLRIAHDKIHRYAYERVGERIKAAGQEVDNYLKEKDPVLDRTKELISKKPFSLLDLQKNAAFMTRHSPRTDSGPYVLPQDVVDEPFMDVMGSVGPVPHEPVRYLKNPDKYLLDVE